MTNLLHSIHSQMNRIQSVIDMISSNEVKLTDEDLKIIDMLEYNISKYEDLLKDTTTDVK